MKVSRRWTGLASLVGVLGMAGTAAWAGPSEPNFGVRLKPSGIDKLVEIAPAALPSTLSLDPMGGTAIDCPLVSDMTIELSPQYLELNWRAFDLDIQDGGIVVRATLDVDGAGDLDLDNTLCVPSSSTCQVGIRANLVEIDADLPLMSTEAGLQAGEPDVRVHVYPENFFLTSEGCLAGDAFETVFGWFESKGLELITERIEERAREAIPALIASKLDTTMPLHIEKAGFHIDALLSQLELSAQTGLTVGGSAAVTWMGGDGSVPEFEPAEGPALPGDFPGDVAIAATDGLIGGALYEAWRGGVFAAKLSELAPTIALSEDGLAKKLGLPGGTELAVSLDLSEAPVVEFGRGGEGVYVGLPGLQVGIDITPPEGPAGHVDIVAIASLQVTFTVDPVRGALNLGVEDLRVDELSIDAGEGQVVRADPARLALFISDVGAPMLAQKLAGLPLSPAIKPSPELDAYVYLRDLQAAGGWLRAGADLYTPDPGDHLPPNTGMDLPKVVPAGMAVVPVFGFDDGTPRGLMRFQIFIDGEPVHPEPTLMSAARLSMDEGQHTVQIAAVDMGGNVDPSPEIGTVIVDGVPPELSVEGAPPVVLPAAGVVDVSWAASDDRTGVAVRWQLREYPNRADVGTVAAEGSGAPQDALHLDDFDDGSLYVLRIVAEDEAGNLTSEELGFALEQGGCNAGGDLATSWLSLGVLALFALFGRRRRERGAALTTPAALAALACMALPASALAQGSTFSGPTDSDGASAYWNPAAMSLGRGTRLEMGSSLSAVRAHFTPEDAAEGSSTFIPKPSPLVGGYTDALAPRLRVGFTVGMPQASGAEWDRDDPAGQVTRYYAAKAMNYHLSTTLAASYELADWVAVGAGASFVYGRLDADFDKDMGAQLNAAAGSSQPAPFPLNHPDLAAPVQLSTDGFGVGGVAGVVLAPSPYVTIGSSIHTPVKITSRGDIEVEYPERMRDFVAAAAPAAELPELSGVAEAGLDLPLSVHSAIAIHPTATFEVRLDHRFYNTSTAQTLDVIIVEATSPDVVDTSVIKGNRDTHAAGLRLTQSFSRGRVRAALLGRFQRSKIPERTTTPSNMDFDRYELGGAVQWRLNQRLALVGQYSHLYLAPQTVEESLYRPVLDPALHSMNKPAPQGRYGGAADTLAVYLSAFY